MNNSRAFATLQVLVLWDEFEKVRVTVTFGTHNEMVEEKQSLVIDWD